jgi:hypothetical protein
VLSARRVIRFSPVGKWRILAEDLWYIVGEYAWYNVGEYLWYNVGEYPWYIIGCSVTQTGPPLDCDERACLSSQPGTAKNRRGQAGFSGTAGHFYGNNTFQNNFGASITTFDFVFLG